MEKKDVRTTVRQGYAKVAKQERSYCCSGPGKAETVSANIGYSAEEMDTVPEGANLGLGCGNPTALASLKEGEVVLDLGSGAGFDCFLAAAKVGESGRVIGVDMTPDMLEKARVNALKGDYRNVEFRLGEIENLPVADNSVDVIISNCVINLSPDKPRVFWEALRVLKPGGRLMVSDIALLKELPDFIRASAAAYVGCIAGAVKKEVYLQTVGDAGFTGIKVVEEAPYPIQYTPNEEEIVASIEKSGCCDSPKEGSHLLEDTVVSMKLEAWKP